MKRLHATIALAGILGAASACAAPFEVAVSPSRFELSGKAAGRIGQSLEIFNVGATATEVSVRTLDWTYSAEGNISYVDELLPGSCRPWVTLERKTLKVGARSKAAFRFQLDLPADAPKSECRFMLAIEGVEPAYRSIVEGGGASLSLPVSGRIAIAVYLSVNGAEPQLTLSQVAMNKAGGKRVPTVTVTNAGDAHGRLDGSLEALDAKGLQFELVPEGTPIMPGQTRTLALVPRPDGAKTPLEPVYPLKISGSLDWERGGFKINAELK